MLIHYTTVVIFERNLLMPCNCDYLEPTNKERKLREAAQLFVWLAPQVGAKIPDGVRYQARNTYGQNRLRNPECIVPDLCELVKSLTPKQLDEYVYNGRNKDARRLADWWEEHKEADKQRIAREKQEQDGKALAKKAAAKLTDEELAAVRKFKP